MKSKPPDVTIRDHCDHLRSRLSASQITRPGSSSTLNSRTCDTSGSLESHAKIRALEDRIRGLEALLERSETEADRAKLALSTHLALHPETSGGGEESPPVKKKAIKRKQPDSSTRGVETQRKRGTRKAPGAKPADGSRASKASLIKELTPYPTLESLTERLKNGTFYL